MKRFLSMLALAVLVLQSVVTSAVYATDLANPSEETVPETAVETEVADPVSDENSNDDVADLVDFEATTVETEKAEPVVEPEQKIEEISAETETSVVEESAVEKDEVEVLGEIDAEEVEDVDFYLPKFGLFKSPVFTKVLNIENPKGECNSESTDTCIVNPVHTVGSLDNPGDVQITKVVEAIEGVDGEYKITVEVKGNPVEQKISTQNNICAVVVFDRSGSMGEGDKVDICTEGYAPGECKEYYSRLDGGNHCIRRKWGICQEYECKSFAGEGECKTTATEYKKRLDAVAGAKLFATTLNGLNGESEIAKIGLVTFAGDPNNANNDVAIGRNLDFSDLTNGSFGTHNGGTNFDAGLLKAQELLNSDSFCTAENSKRYIVAITDGAPTYAGVGSNRIGNGGNGSISTVTPKTSEDAATIRNSGIEIFTIGYQLEKVNGFDTAKYLKDDIANQPNDKISQYAFEGANADKVAQAFQTISESIQELAAGTEANLEDKIGGNVTIVAGSDNHEPNKLENFTITEDGQTIEFYVKIKDGAENGDYDTNAGVYLTYTGYDYDGNPIPGKELSIKDSSKIHRVQPPCEGTKPTVVKGVTKMGAETYPRKWNEAGDALEPMGYSEWTYVDAKPKLEACEWTCDGEGYVREGDTCVLQKYTITWKDGDGNTLKTDEVEYGNVPSYDGKTPTKTATSQYTYTFNNTWSPEIEEAKANAEYVAQFAEKLNEYTVKFVDDDDKEISSKKYVYGTNAADIEEPTNPEKVGYTFDKWAPELTDVTSDATYKATYTINRYTITFDTAGGSEILPITQDYNTEVTKPADPTKKDYRFAGWDKEVPSTMPAENMTITASWDDDKNNNDIADKDEIFTVLFNDEDGENLNIVENLKLGDRVEEYTPTKTDYVFDKWTPDFQNTVRAEDANTNSEIIYTGSWKDDKNNNGTADDEEEFTVIYKDGNDVLKTETGLALNAELMEYEPTKEGYTFKARDPEWVNTVKAENANENSEIIYNATWDVISYKLTYMVDDKVYGNVETVEYGTKLTARPEPTKEGYKFEGWTPEVPETMPAKDVVIEGRFVANSDTAYTVEYYFQNVEGSDYVLDEEKTENKAGTTDSEVSVLPEEVSGFTLNNEKSKLTGKVSADKKLVLEVYYDRAESSVTIDPNCDDEGSKICGEPTVETGNYEKEVTLPGGNRSYTLSYKVGEGAPSVESQTVSADIIGYCKGESADCDKSERFSVGTTVKIEAEPVIYTAVWSSNMSVTVAEGSDYQTDSTGYTFNTWKDGDNDVEAKSELILTSDKELVADYTKSVRTYTVIFLDEDEETQLQSGQVAYNTMPEYTGETPTKQGETGYVYTFSGWNPEIVKVTGDAEYVAIYTESCDTGYHYEGAEGATAQLCVENDKTDLDCSGKIPDNATAIEGHGKVHQTWADNGWTPTSMERDNQANECGFTCDSGYVYYLSGDEASSEKLCMKTEIEVSTAEVCPEIPEGENTRYEKETEIVTWNAEEGRYNDPLCRKVCAPRYHEEEQSCVPDIKEVETPKVCGELAKDSHAYYLTGTQTLTYTVDENGEGSWSEPNCETACEPNYRPVEEDAGVGNDDTGIENVNNDPAEGEVRPVEPIFNAILNSDMGDGTANIPAEENDVAENIETPKVNNFKCVIITNKVTFDLNGGTVAQGVETVVEVDSGDTVEQIATTKNGYTFQGWTLDGQAFDFSTPITQDITLVAQWKSNGGGGGGGGGNTRDFYKCENLPENAVANNTSKPNRNTDYSYSTDTSIVCTFQCKSGYTRDKDNKKCVKSEQPGGSDDEEIELGGQVSDKCSVEGSNRSEEEVAAYLYACENDITTIRDINEARLGDFLTRAEMAKMISVFATKELGMKPNTSKDCSNFANSIASYSQEMKDYMVMSCQLEIMGIHTTNYEPIPDFMPSKRVSRAEFGTVLSRILWGNKYEGTNSNYYVNHLNALKENNIITNINPNITEYRAWVFLMLYRSVEAIKVARANTSETVEEQVNEELQEEGKAETGLVLEYDSGSVVPDMAVVTESGTLATGAVAEVDSGSTVEAQTGDTASVSDDDISKEVSAETGSVAETQTGSTSD